MKLRGLAKTIQKIHGIDFESEKDKAFGYSLSIKKNEAIAPCGVIHCK